jgi:hypothetical protein
MAKADDKKRPITERIASLMGKGAYCDAREGFSMATTRFGLSDQDLAAALGMVAAAKGSLAVKVMETHYGSSLLHLEALLRAWDEHEHDRAKDHGGRTRDEVCLTRFGGELAIRELASIRYGTPQLAHFAYLLQSRRETLQLRKDDAFNWLREQLFMAEAELHEVVREKRYLERDRKTKNAA